MFDPAIRRLALDAQGLNRKSLRAGLTPWALDYRDEADGDGVLAGRRREATLAESAAAVGTVCWRCSASCGWPDLVLLFRRRRL